MENEIFITSTIRKLLSALISIIIIIFISYVILMTSGYLYDYLHPISDPTLRGDDLGCGLVVVAVMLVTIILSYPCFFILYKFFLKKLTKQRR